LIIEQRLWSIPLSDPIAERVEEVVESDDVQDLYRLYENFIENIKSKSRQHR